MKLTLIGSSYMLSLQFRRVPLYLSVSRRLFCRDDDTGFRHGFEGAVDAVDILALKLMVVTEGEGLYSLCHWLDVVFHLFGRCNTRQEQHMIVGHSRQGRVFHFFLFIALDFLWLQFLAVEYAFWGIIVNAGEVELLEG